MLQDIRDNAQGTIAKVIIGVLIVSLSIWGMDAIVGGFRGEPTVATVNGDDIAERDFLRFVQIETQRRLSEMESPDPSLLDEDIIRGDVLESLIQDQVLLQDARQQGFDLSDEGIDAVITQMPQFQVGGQFSQEQFVATVRNFGMGIGEYREALRRNYLMNQVANGIFRSTVVPLDAARQILAIQNQSRDFRTYTLSASLVADEVQVTDADIEEWYNANSDRFVNPESVEAEYLVLSLSDLIANAEISEETLRELYEQRVADMEAGEERRSAHILIEPGDDAEARIAEVQTRLEAGDDFADVAREFSDDSLSASEGGDLGYIARGGLDDDYEAALFALAEGEISGPVETGFGMHIIRLLDIRTESLPSLEDMLPDLRDELAATQAGEEYARLRTRMADLAFAEDNLDYPAEQLGLEIRSTEGITREGGQAPFDHPGLVRQLFSQDVLEDGFNSEMIDVGDNRSVVARVRQHNPESQRELAEVADDIRERLVRERTTAALQTRADALIERLDSGEAEPDGEGWTVYNEVTRNQPLVDPAVQREAFSLPRPESGAYTFGTARMNQDLVVVALETVTDGEVDVESPELAQIRQFLASINGQREYRAYQETLRERAEVSRP
ncbi:SurA N-terminal domain-containing protein [uncultured Marinobacter sp.]|uniref:SurA N-terminal domain-containing protein n=1 Tax=uncultured Marinobacter sp. TaxID=187379 RepID=UPI0030DB198E